MKIGIVIVSYNGLKYLPAVLKSACDYGERAEIYVVDNASSDDSVDYVKKNWPAAKLTVCQTNLGFAGGYNVGIKQALADGAEAVLLLNQDTALTAGGVGKLASFLEQNPKLGLVQPRVSLPNGRVNSLGNCYHYLGFGYAGGNGYSYDAALRRLPWFKKQSDIPYFSGAAVLIRAEALKQVGGFDEHLFLYHEDLELGLRMRCYGWGMQVVPEAEVIHHYHFAPIANNFYYMERNRFLVWFSYFKLPTLALLLVPLILADLALMASSIFSGWFGVYLRSRGYFFTLSAWRYIFRKRHEVRKFKTITDKYLLSFASGVIHWQESDAWHVRFIFNPLASFGWFIIKPLIRW